MEITMEMLHLEYAFQVWSHFEIGNVTNWEGDISRLEKVQIRTIKKPKVEISNWKLQDSHVNHALRERTRNVL